MPRLKPPTTVPEYHHGQLDQTLRSHFELLYRIHRLAGKSPETVRLHRTELNGLARYLGREALVSDLSDELLLGYMAWQAGRGLVPQSINRGRSKLVAQWKFLYHKGIASKWPDVRSLTEPEHDPIAWTEEQLPKIWAACEAVPGFICGIPANNWWHGLHAVLWDSGERIGAVIELDWSTVDLDAGWCRFPARIRKGKKKDLTCRLHPDTAEFLRRIQRPEGKVFPWHRHRCTLWLHYDRLLKRAGLPHDRKHKFHCMRKSVASYFEAAGGDATKLLGHSSRKVTEAYLDPKICTRQHAVDLLPRFNTPPAAAEVRAG